MTANERARAVRARRRAAGLCGTCGGPVPEGRATCEACYARVKQWQRDHPDRYLAARLSSARRLRAKVIAHYGGRCACCGESEPAFLAIDHLNGDGAAHRRAHGTNKIERWLHSQGYPDGYQVLCHNCNMARGFYGKCPHQA